MTNTRNTWEDGEGYSLASLNSLKHAFEGEGVKSGGAISPGTGDFEVDITAVDYHIGDAGYSATADSLTHDAPDSEDRIDLITADTTNSVKIVKGDPATVSNQPDSADIPADEVLLGAVLVREGGDEILDSDIFDDYKTIVHLLEDWTTDGESGEVPVSQGDGTVQMDKIEGAESDGAEHDLLVVQSDGTLDTAQGEGSGIDADTIRGESETDTQFTSESFTDVAGPRTGDSFESEFVFAYVDEVTYHAENTTDTDNFEYDFWTRDISGGVIDSTTIVLDGGQSDSVTAKIDQHVAEVQFDTDNFGEQSIDVVLQTLEEHNHGF